jgi:hypothetical protein
MRPNAPSRRLLALCGLFASLALTACPTPADHKVPLPTGGDADTVNAGSVPRSGVIVLSPRPLASGSVITSARPTPTLIQAVRSPTPSPQAAPTPEPTDTPEAVPSATPTPKPSLDPGPFPGAGPSPIIDPTLRFFPSPTPR